MTFKRVCVLCILQVLALASDEVDSGAFRKKLGRAELVKLVHAAMEGVDLHLLKVSRFGVADPLIKQFLDANADGVVSQDELDRATSSLESARKSYAATISVHADETTAEVTGLELVRKTRTSHRVKLDKSEEAAVSAIDADLDNQMNEAELSKFGFGDAGIQRTLDSNGDGTVSRDEFNAAVNKAVNVVTRKQAAHLALVTANEVVGADVGLAGQMRDQLAVELDDELRVAAKTAATLTKTVEEAKKTASALEKQNIKLHNALARKLDANHDGVLQKVEFNAAVLREPSLDSIKDACMEKYYCMREKDQCANDKDMELRQVCPCTCGSFAQWLKTYETDDADE